MCTLVLWKKYGTSVWREITILLEHLDNDQAGCLWEHPLHVDNELYSRMNFFLVFESVLLGVVGMLYNKTTPSSACDTSYYSWSKYNDHLVVY